MNKDYFTDFVGQPHIKSKLGFYLDNYKKTNYFPSTLVTAPMGMGKSTLCRIIGKHLKKDFIEVNGASLKSKSAFFDNLVLPHMASPRKATIFFDESQSISNDVQTQLLSILETNKTHVTYLQYQGGTITFNFKELTVLMGTNQVDKLLPPLLDRIAFRRQDFRDYSDKELAEVLFKNSSFSFENDELVEDIISVSRRNCRMIVNLSEDLALVTDGDKLTMDKWIAFKKRMGLKILGLNDREVYYLKALEKRGSASLTALGAVLVLNPQTVRKDVENFLLKHNLIMLDKQHQRILSPYGKKICQELS